MLFTFALACSDIDPGFLASGVRNDRDDVAVSFTVAGGEDDPNDSGDTAAGDDVDAICDAADLDLSVVVEAGTGGEATAFSYPTEITTRALFTNPCNGFLRFTTPTTCLVDRWTLTDGAAHATSFAGNCVNDETTWTLDALETTEVTASWGVLERSTYTIAAYSDVVGRSATEFFSVQ